MEAIGAKAILENVLQEIERKKIYRRKVTRKVIDKIFEIPNKNIHSVIKTFL